MTENAIVTKQAFRPFPVDIVPSALLSYSRKILAKWINRVRCLLRNYWDRIWKQSW